MQNHPCSNESMKQKQATEVKSVLLFKDIWRHYFSFPYCHERFFQCGLRSKHISHAVDQWLPTCFKPNIFRPHVFLWVIETKCVNFWLINAPQGLNWKRYIYIFHQINTQNITAKFYLQLKSSLQHCPLEQS